MSSASQSAHAFFGVWLDFIPFPFWVQGEECGSGGTMRVKTGEPTVLKSRTNCF